MNGDTPEYNRKERVRLKSTRRGNRTCAGSLEVGAGEAAGNVAGGSDGVALFEAPLVLAMVTRRWRVRRSDVHSGCCKFKKETKPHACQGVYNDVRGGR